MNQNAQADLNDSDIETAKNLEIQKIFKPKSDWRPNPPNRILKIFQRSIKQEILKSKPKKVKHNNLSKQERIGLKQLRDNPDIVIKKADKGSAVVVMNTTHYLREGYRQLQDTNFNQKIPHDITNQISDNIANQLAKMRSLNLITEKNFEYLHIKNPTKARFYFLSKIYEKNILGRPICSINHPTSNI